MRYMPRVYGEDLFDEWMNDFPFTNMSSMLPVHGVFGKHEKNLMKTDVREKDGSYILDVDLPGFKKEDIKAELKDGYLTISAVRSLDKDTKGEDGAYIRRERFSGSCSRSFYVGDAVEQKDMKAKFENGILTVSFPKEDKKQLPQQSSQIAIEG